MLEVGTFLAKIDLQTKYSERENIQNGIILLERGEYSGEIYI